MSLKQDDLAASVSIDPENPWLGLSSYTEETRAYFHGRDEEAAELARRVQRKNLTVLFGQSGLGKTSLLRAGLVPRLRGEGFCPVYVRVDYSPDSRSPSEQIKQAIFRATSEAGHWSRPGTAIEGESLWEFLHHRGDLLRDSGGRTLMPLLIFDQFEEIFTLAQADDRGRLRAKHFLEDLADLAENRPPVALEQRLDQDEAAAEDFDFARADYRILIALREDYLAHLESVKGIMPSITQNRMRLARMTGAQALSAVIQPGGRLVSQEVAESIVRFVAGGTELANAEVEPSLLSLVCRELNTVRIAQKRPEISADLLAGSRDTILTEFYERALADQPEGVRRVIEDELLTESGYRESLAEERVIKALAAAGAEPDALAKLVNRRLLRIEERLDMRRVELTHDVLCSIVASSRDLRHEREARDEAERQLAAQKEREAATRRALVRARTIAAVCAVLAVLAAASAVFGYVATERAKLADAQAQQARGDAEKLVGFLIEDFYEELEPTGRLDTLGKLAHEAVAYFEGLPAGLMTPQSNVYRGMALIREGGVLLAGDDVEAGLRHIAQARELFEKLHAGGDTSEPIVYGLALSLVTPFFSGSLGGPGSGPDDVQKAADLLRPLVYGPGGSRRVKLTYADLLNVVSQSKQNREDGVAMCEESRKILAGLGALDLSDLTATSRYADVADTQVRILTFLRRFDEAERLEQEVYDLVEKALTKRPGDIRSMRNRFYAAEQLSTIAIARHDYAAAARYAARSEQAGEEVVRFNPSDPAEWSLWSRGFVRIATVYAQQGEVGRAIQVLRAAAALRDDPRAPSAVRSSDSWVWFNLASWEAQAGQHAAAERSLEAGLKADEESIELVPEGDVRRAVVEADGTSRRARTKLAQGDSTAAYDLASTAVRQLEQFSLDSDDIVARGGREILQASLGTVTEAALRLGRYAEAEATARRAIAMPRSSFAGDPLRGLSTRQVQLAYAIAMQGRGSEAQAELTPALEFYGSEKKAGARTTSFRLEYAAALVASALAQPPDTAGRAARRRALAEADAELAGASAEVRQLSDSRVLAGRIAAARATSGS
jgi:tetratricopeptide (TPR) repeat protein